MDGVQRASTPDRQPEVAGQESSNQGSPLRRVSSERFKMLYKDNEMRQRRWLARYEAKRKKEEDTMRQQMERNRSRRAFDSGSFKTWYESSTKRFFQAEKLRRDQRLLEQQK